MPSASSSKRSSHAAFGGDDGGYEVTVSEATSNLRNDTHRKKPRVSKAGSSRRSVMTPPDQSTPESDQAQDMQEPDGLPTPPPATQYELMRDAGFEHLRFVEQDDQRATQRLKDRPALIGDNHAALNAIIESITCYNFMCHTRLHCELGPLLNFIVGENGSGKSAILTAITLCLGGKASATNRGGSLRSFVKEGQEHASLVVKIKNQGDDAYKPEIFGESIVCERWFNKSGSSGFKLKSIAQRIISTKKADVDDVVEYFCLQVDNPLNVLSQDNARQFLNAATPAAKYKYFVQGTQLEQLDHDYQLLTEMLDANESKLGEHEENITYLKEKYEKAIKLRDAIGKTAEMRQKAQFYKNQLAWAQVIEQENILEEKENAIVAAQDEIARSEQVINEKAEVLATIDSKVEEAKEALESTKREQGQVQEQEQDIKTKYDDAKKKAINLHAQEREIHSQVSNFAQEVKEYEEQIRKEEAQLEQANGGAVAIKQRERDEAQEAVHEIQQTIDAHTEESKTLKDEFARTEMELQEFTKIMDDKQKEVFEAESQLRAFSQNRSDPLAGYHANMPQLLKLIDNDSGFSQKPIGPLGTHVELLKPAWSAILEKTFGQNLSGFIVFSKPDQVRLAALMDRLKIPGQNHPILIGGRSINTVHEPDEQFDTILRVLRIDDRRVRDQLIINNFIDQTLLIESREEAQRVMLDGQQPANTVACLCFHDTKRGHGFRISKRNNDNFSTSPVTPDKSVRPRMKPKDNAAQTAVYKDAVDHHRLEFRDLERQRRTLDQSVQRANKAVSQHKKQATVLQAKFREAQVRVSHIDEELDQFEGVDQRLQSLKNNRVEAQSKKDHYGNQYGELALQKRMMNEDVEGLKKELSKAKLASQDFATKVSKAKSKVDRFEETRRLAIVEKNQAHENLGVAQIGRTNAEGSRDRQAETVAEYQRQASEITPERTFIPEGETHASIERKYASLRDHMRKLQQQMGASEEEINNRAAEATREYRDAKRSQKNLTSLVDGLKKALWDRLEKYRQFQRHVSAHARTNFGYLLSERGFRGQLRLDHKSKKLEVQVEPDETRRSGKGRNTKTLSGGEKSFSSICLLLAIWDAMGSPLRCLDEFDVFMDNVNRAISTNMLVTAARRSVGKQFILITPNAIEGRATIEKDVKIIRLTDPRQTRLADP